MSERWREPVVPLAIDFVDQGLWLPDGRKFGAAVPVLKASDIDRARAGYLCLKCLEPFEHAWPERCHVCGAPIRTEQAAYLAREFGGEIKLGPSTSLEDELAALREKETPNGS